MPPIARWKVVAEDALRQLEGDPDGPPLTRADVERLFSVSRSRAAVMMRELDAERLGSAALVLPRPGLIARLRAVREGVDVRREVERRQRFVQVMERARIAGRRVKLSDEARRAHLEGLPEGVVLEPGELRVRFSGFHEFVDRLAAVVSVLQRDGLEVERLLGTAPSTAAPPGTFPAGGARREVRTPVPLPSSPPTPSPDDGLDGPPTPPVLFPVRGD